MVVSRSATELAAVGLEYIAADLGTAEGCALAVAETAVIGDIWSMTGLLNQGTFIYEPAGEAHTLVVTDDSPEPAQIVFMVEAGLIYLDKPTNGGFAAYEDGFSLLELWRNYYREADLDVGRLDLLIR